MPANQQLPEKARAALVRLEQQHGQTIGQHDLQTPVTIFFVDWCGFCKQLKKEAEASGNRVTLVNVTPHEQSPQIRAASLPGFPIVRIGTDDWQVRMGIDGRVRVTYLSSTSGTITWGTAIVIARLLGFVDATLTVAEGETATAPYPPMGVIYCKAREKATDWTMRAAGFAGSLAGDGRVAGRSDGRRLLTQTFTSRVHPRTWAEANEYGSYATPLQSQDTTPARIFQPTGPLGVLPPWSVDEFAATALGHRCAFALGTFQSLVAGTRTDFEVGYLLPEMIRDLKSPKAAGNWRAFRDVDFALSRVPGLNPDGTETR